MGNIYEVHDDFVLLDLPINKDQSMNPECMYNIPVFLESGELIGVITSHKIDDGLILFIVKTK